MTAEAAVETAIDIAGLNVVYRARGRPVRALVDVSFTSRSERRIAVVGESGSGKSTLGLAMLGLLPPSAIMTADRMLVAGQDVAGSSERERQRFRGRQLAMIFQDASASLDPLRTVGYQVAEPLKAHLDLGRRERAAEVNRLLSAARIPDPLVRARQYPHQFSGGMRQRAMMATGLAGQPAVIVADEPTSALDVTTQSAILDLVRELGDMRQMTTLLITHDLAVVAGFAETVVVLYAGRVIERGPVARVYTAAGHPYTRALLSAIPRIDGPRRAVLGTIPGSLPDLTAEPPGCVFEPRCWRGKGEDRCRTEAPALRRLTSGTVAACHFAEAVAASDAALNYYAEQTPSLANADAAGKGLPEPVLAVSGLSKTYVRRGVLGRGTYRTPAVSEVELTVPAGESVGIVGESGSGKTTLARLILGLEKRDGGTVAVRFNGALRDINSAPPTGYAQMVFQDPGDSLNPLMSVEEVISEPLSLRDHRSWRHYRQQVAELLADVGLSPDMARRRPHELSGGQRQRVAIARAIATEPQLIIADEAVASLDVSARGQILNLMRSLQRAHRFAYLHISHDLSLVRNICDRVVVMYGGRIVESAEADELFAKPKHPYTQLLLDAVPRPDVDRSQADQARTRQNEYAETSYAELMAGCPFRSRCPLSDDKCVESMPPLAGPPQHTVACHHADAAIALRRNQMTSDAPA